MWFVDFPSADSNRDGTCNQPHKHAKVNCSTHPIVSVEWMSGGADMHHKSHVGSREMLCSHQSD